MTNLFSKIATTGAVLLGTSGIIGCGASGKEKYEFKGFIGGERVKFTSTSVLFDGYFNGLSVAKNDGTTIYYTDERDNDLRLERVEIAGNGMYTDYYVNEFSSLEPLKKYQAEFDAYLTRILEVKDSLAKTGNSK